MLFLRVFFDFFFFTKNGYCTMSVNSEYLIRKKNRIFHDVDNGRMAI